MIKAVIFDYGGVITDGGSGNELAERLAGFLKIPIEQAKDWLFKPWQRFATGKIDENEYWREIESDYGYPIPAEHRLIWNTWESMFPRPAMIDYVRDLKSRGFIVGLLSNVIPVTEKIIHAHDGYELFEPRILSNLIGLAKPDPKIYEELLRQLPGVNPEEIIFIDDRQSSLDPAIKIGIKTVLAHDAIQIIAAVEALLD